MWTHLHSARIHRYRSGDRVSDNLFELNRFQYVISYQCSKSANTCVSFGEIAYKTDIHQAKCVQSLVIIITLNISSHAIKRVRIIAAAVYVYTLVVISYITRVCVCVRMRVRGLVCTSNVARAHVIANYSGAVAASVVGRSSPVVPGASASARCASSVRTREHSGQCMACSVCFWTMCQWRNSRKVRPGRSQRNVLCVANGRSLALLNRSWWCFHLNQSWLKG